MEKKMNITMFLVSLYNVSKIKLCYISTYCMCTLCFIFYIKSLLEPFFF